jgi:hypothetical protein
MFYCNSATSKLFFFSINSLVCHTELTIILFSASTEGKMQMFAFFLQLLCFGVFSSGSTTTCAATETTSAHGTAGQAGHQGDSSSKTAANSYEPAEDVQ